MHIRTHRYGLQKEYKLQQLQQSFQRFQKWTEKESYKINQTSSGKKLLLELLVSGLRKKLLQSVVMVKPNQVSDRTQRVRSTYRYTSRKLDLWLARQRSAAENRLKVSRPQSLTCRWQICVWGGFRCSVFVGLRKGCYFLSLVWCAGLSLISMLRTKL